MFKFRSRKGSPPGPRDEPRIAFVLDALTYLGGAERVLAQALRVFPRAAVHTLVYNPENFADTPIGEAEIHTSFINTLPGAHHNHRIFFPLYPMAVERMDLSAYDIVVSFSYAASHGVLTGPDQRHIVLYYTPLRRAYKAFQEVSGEKSLSSRVLYYLLHSFRAWDVKASRRPDQVYAVSQWAARRVWQAYHRTAQVIYPPVEIERFQASYPREDYFICVSRMEPHKRLDLLVQAFNQSRRSLVLVGEGQEKNRLRKMAGSHIHILDNRSDREIASLLGKARAFVHAAAEDFGITLVEAQAAGCPVIAFQQGGASETVLDGRTGILFSDQSAECLNEAVTTFETREKWFSPSELRSSAERYAPEKFRRKFAALVLAGLQLPPYFAARKEYSWQNPDYQTVTIG